MSSESSVTTSTTSRVRQFGLYRSIDARTEEFLRLSRKRQIKQGCACAAVSTAITVTVVITAFLVYMEYGMATESRSKPLGKSSWLGLVNDSLATSLEEKFSKNNLNFDRTTIKLLPILIKALKHNRYLEKIIENYSSSSPLSDGKFTTEYAYQKNIFATKNLLKKPTSKLYAIEYKTSPILFFKNSNRDIGYFTKIRKIRDYQRVMSYVNKMINDNTGYQIDSSLYSKEYFNTNKPTIKSHTSPIKKTNSKGNKNRKVTKPPRKLKHTTTKMMKKKNLQKSSEITGCKCPKQLTVILDKILSSIQQLIPDRKLNTFNPCETSLREKKVSEKRNDTEPTSIPTTIHGTINTTSIKAKKYSSANRTTTKNNLSLSEFGHLVHKNHPTRPKVDFKLLTPKKSFSSNKFSHWIKTELKTTTTKPFIEPPVSITISSTQPMSPTTSKSPYQQSISSLSSTDKHLFATSDNWDQTKSQTPNNFITTTTKSSSRQATKRMNMPLFIDSEYDDFTDITEINKRFYLQTPSIKVFSINIDKPNVTVNQSKQNPFLTTTANSTTTNNVDETLMNLSKTVTNQNYTRHWIKDFIHSKQTTKTHISSSKERTTRIDENLKPLSNMMPYTNKFKTLKTSASEMTPVTEYLSVNSNEYTNFDYVLHKMSTEQITTEGKIFGPIHVLEDPRDDDYRDELKEKPTEQIPYTTSKAHKQMKQLLLSLQKDNNINNFNFNSKHDLKTNGNTHEQQLNSMLPQSRPTYLHIQRNGWKHEDIDDYDNSAK